MRSLRSGILTCACLLTLGFSVLFAAPAPGNSPREDFWITDGNVNAVAITNGVAYLGGDFRFVGPASGGAAALESATGLLDPSFPRVNGSVFTAIGDGRGGRYIGGSFDSIGGVAVINAAHLLSDRTVDPLWKPNPDGAVTALAASETTIFLGGAFTTVAGNRRVALAAVDATNAALKPMNPGTDNLVRTLLYVEEADILVVGGDFTTIGGQQRTGIAAVNAQNGAVTAWAPQANGSVTSMARLNSTLYVAGGFTQIGFAARSGLAALDVYTGFATGWAPEANNIVATVIVTCDTVFAGGKFTFVGGLERHYLAALDPVSGAALPLWDARIPVGDIFTSDVTTLSARGETIYVGGHFDSVWGIPRVGVAAVDAIFGFPTDWVPDAAGSVTSIDVNGENVYVGGYSICVGGGEPRNYLAAIDLTSGKLLDWNPSANRAVYALTATASTIYAGGDFTEIGGVARNGMAAISTTSGQPTAFNANAQYNWNAVSGVGTVLTIGLRNGLVYAGGHFTQIGGQNRSGLAELDSNGRATSWNPTPVSSDGFQFEPGVIRSMALTPQVVYVAGNFTSIGGANHVGLAAIDPNGFAYLWNPDAYTFDLSTFQFLPGQVNTILLDGSILYAGGLFNYVGGDVNRADRNGLVAIDAVTGQNSLWDPQPDQAHITTLQMLDGTLYVGGLFNSIGGQARLNVAGLIPSTGAMAAWNPGPSSEVRAIAGDGKSVLLAGNFTSIGSRHRPTLASFQPTGAPVMTSQPASEIVPVGQAVTLRASASGQGLQYQWRKDGGNIPGATGATLNLGNVNAGQTGIYDVRISNASGVVFSDQVVVVAFVPPTLTRQPAAQTVNAGGTATLSVAAPGTPQPEYQWRRNGVNIPGANQASYTISNARPQDGGSFDVVVANAGGSLVSATAEVLIPSTALPFADAFNSRGTISGASGIGSGRNTQATIERGEPSHAGKPGGKSVWLNWRAPANGVATFRTEGSAFDTVLAVYTGAALGSLNAQASDDDRAGYLTSEAIFSAVAGQDYQIAIDGFGAASGNIVLSWNLNSAQSIFPVIQVPPASVTVTNGGTATFSVVATGPGQLFYQWYYNCIPIPLATNKNLIISPARLRNAGSYIVRVYNAFGYEDSNPAFLDLGPDADLRGEDKFLNLGGSTPTLFSLAGRDQLNGAGVVRGFSGSQVFSTFGTTTEPGEPLHCGIPGGASVWFPVKAEVSGPLTINTDGSDFDTVLAVYTGPGTGFDSLIPVACDDNSGLDGRDSAVTFNAVAGTIYFVAVDGVGGTSGTAVLNVIAPTGGPRLDFVRTAIDGNYLLRLSGKPNVTYLTETSANLVNWTAFSTNTSASGVIDINNATAKNTPQKFYRCRQK